MTRSIDAKRLSPATETSFSIFVFCSSLVYRLWYTEISASNVHRCNELFATFGRWRSENRIAKCDDETKRCDNFNVDSMQQNQWKTRKFEWKNVDGNKNCRKHFKYSAVDSSQFSLLSLKLVVDWKFGSKIKLRSKCSKTCCFDDVDQKWFRCFGIGKRTFETFLFVFSQRKRFEKHFALRQF